MSERWLSPAEVAARFGVSRKALRLYEAAGLVAPLRRPNGWRAYGPETLARLHQVRVLRRWGLPLVQIGALLAGGGAGLDTVLNVQQNRLESRAGETARALAAVRAARALLARGETIGIDHLVELAEATMADETKVWGEALRPFVEKHFTPDEREAVGQRKAAAYQAAGYDEAGFAAAWADLFREAEALRATDDTTSARARALLRRWREMVGHFTWGDPALAAKAGAVWQDALAEPGAASRLGVKADIFAFVERIAASEATAQT